VYDATPCPYMIQVVAEGFRHVYCFPAKAGVWDHYALFEREFHEGVWSSISIWKLERNVVAMGIPREQVYSCINRLGD